MIRRRSKDELAPVDYWWDPYDMSTRSILDEMDRLFADFRTGFENSLAAPRQSNVPALRTPALDLVDKGKEYELKVEMPGMKKEDVSIEVGEREVQISAEVKEQKEEKAEEGGYIRRERRYSRIYRMVPLPENVQSEKTSAEMKDGLLIITLPKTSAQGKKSRKVEVK